MYQPGSERRFNRKCKDCGARFSALCRVVRAEHPSTLPGWELFSPRDREHARHVYRSLEQGDFLAWANDPYKLLYRCRCGKLKLAEAVLGKFRKDVPCNDKCVSAIGGKCECQCGGKNHGASYGS